MLEINSVNQILRVLDLARQNRRLGFVTSVACSRAIQQVAKEGNLRYQTIGDGCRRRLQLVDMSEFHRLVDEWLSGNHARLAAVLKRNSTPGAAPRIGAFFGTGQSAAKLVGKSVAAAGSGSGAEDDSPNPVKITIENADARMLHVLAQLEARDPAVIAVELVRMGMKDRLRAVLA